MNAQVILFFFFLRSFFVLISFSKMFLRFKELAQFYTTFVLKYH